MKFLVFDTETTGLPQTKYISPDYLHLWPHIVQFSYVIYDSSLNTIIKSVDNIIKLPENILISQESTKIHGITNEQSRLKGKFIHDILNEFCNDIRTIDRLIGHNIDFDISMVKVELLRIIYGNNIINSELKKCKDNFHYILGYKNITCTLKDSIQFCNIKALDKYGKEYLKYPKLSELHEKLFSNTPNNLHNSFNDILVTLRCFMKLKHETDLMKSCETFKNYSNQLGIF